MQRIPFAHDLVFHILVYIGTVHAQPGRGTARIRLDTAQVLLFTGQRQMEINREDAVVAAPGDIPVPVHQVRPAATARRIFDDLLDVVARIAQLVRQLNHRAVIRDHPGELINVGPADVLEPVWDHPHGLIAHGIQAQLEVHLGLHGDRGFGRLQPAAAGWPVHTDVGDPGQGALKCGPEASDQHVGLADLLFEPDRQGLAAGLFRPRRRKRPPFNGPDGLRLWVADVRIDRRCALYVPPRLGHDQLDELKAEERELLAGLPRPLLPEWAPVQVDLQRPLVRRRHERRDDPDRNAPGGARLRQAVRQVHGPLPSGPAMLGAEQGMTRNLAGEGDARIADEQRVLLGRLRTEGQAGFAFQYGEAGRELDRVVLAQTEPGPVGAEPFPVRPGQGHHHVERAFGRLGRADVGPVLAQPDLAPQGLQHVHGIQARQYGEWRPDGQRGRLTPLMRQVGSHADAQARKQQNESGDHIHEHDQDADDRDDPAGHDDVHEAALDGVIVLSTVIDRSLPALESQAGKFPAHGLFAAIHRPGRVLLAHTGTAVMTDREYVR